MAPRVARRSVGADAKGLSLERLADGRGRARVAGETRILATAVQARVDAVAVHIGQAETARTRHNLATEVF